jgi:hypothetical protein
MQEDAPLNGHPATTAVPLSPSLASIARTAGYSPRFPALKRIDRDANFFGYPRAGQPAIEQGRRNW